MKYPNNAHAVKLRVAAVAFARHVPDEYDVHDRDGERVNKQLLAAAVEYTNSLLTCCAGEAKHPAKWRCKVGRAVRPAR